MIYFVRHGSTDWNEFKNKDGMNDPKCQGRIGISLNQTGIAQARQTKHLIKDVKFDLVLTSPLKRAKETMEIIYDGNAPKKVDNRLIERDFGEFEGLSRTQFDFKGFWTVGSNFKMTKAENLNDVIKRAFDLLKDLSDFKTKNVLLVSHGGVGCVIKGFFCEPPIKNYLLSLEMPHGKITLLDPSSFTTKNYPQKLFE